MSLRLIFLFCLTACSPYSNSEFSSCADYDVEPFSHPKAPVSVALPEYWDIETTESGDTLSAMAVDPEREDNLRAVGFLQFPSVSGYRKHLPSLLRSLNPGTATLVNEERLLRIDGVALEYIIGNDELHSTFLISYESPTAGNTVLILGQIERRDDPELSDFCYLGPVLEAFVRMHFSPRS